MTLNVNLCRLCLANDSLVWVFDKRFENSDNMKDIVYITTGVEISTKDIVSQKICEKCCQVTIKMFEFRRTSLANDIQLKKECQEYLRKNNIKIPNTEVTIKNEAKFEIQKIKEEPKEEQRDRTFKVHPSVRNLFDIYPQLKLPTICLKSHIAPVVSLPMDGVENYFKSRNLDFNFYTKLALKSGRVATKRTSAIAKPKNPTAQSKPSTEKKDDSADPSLNTSIKIKSESASKVNPKVNRNSNDQSKPPVKAGNAEEIQPKIKNIVSESVSEDKKRKFSEVEDTQKTESFKKPNFVESLGLTPSSSMLGNAESPAYVANVSVPLHICDICNSVQYSAKDLRKHQNKHLRCQFCKIKFRSLESKDEHLAKSCLIKNTMRDLPDVVLRKIEYSKRARRKYPDAFVDFPPLKSKKALKIENTVPESVETPTAPDLNKQTADNTPEVIAIEKQNEVEIIEILSDDEDSIPAPSGGLLKSLLLPEVSKNGPPNSNVPSQENIVYNTVSIVKPDMRIKGNSILDNVDSKLSDIKFLKELLVNYKRYQLSVEKQAQTDLPSNSSISIINQADYTTELKDLKQQMFVYKIPVVIKNGPFNVTYGSHTETKQPKKLCLWNDLTAIDIKINKVTVPSSVCTSEKQGSDKVNVVENNNISTLPPTGTNSSCDSHNVPMTNATATACVPVTYGTDKSLISPSNSNTSLQTTTVSAYNPVNATSIPVNKYGSDKSLVLLPNSNTSLQSTALSIYNPVNTTSIPVSNYGTSTSFVSPPNSNLPLQTTVTNYNPVNNACIPMNNYNVSNKSFISPSSSALPLQTTTVSNYNPGNSSALPLQSTAVSNYSSVNSSVLPLQTTTASNYNSANSSALAQLITTVSNYNSALPLQTTTVSNYNSALPLQTTTVSNYNPVNSASVTSYSDSFVPPATSIMNADRFLNNYGQTRTSTTMDAVPVTSTPTSAPENPVVTNHSIPVGTIRVKNVWELT